MLLNFNGETGPYIQYIYVRTKSILNKVNYTPNIDIDFTLLNDNATIEVLKQLYVYNEILIDALEKNEPSVLSRYLINLSQSFSNFYNQCQVITEDVNLQNARLFLTYSVGNVLKNGAGLLGMEMPDKM